MKTYETLHLVKSEDLNHHGTLFAARGAAWLIEAGYTTATCEHGDTEEVVLRGLQNVSYSKPVKNGAIVRFTGRVVLTGTTSLVVAITARDAKTDELAIEGYATFVTIDKDTAQKKPHKVVLDESVDEEELKQRERARQIKKQMIKRG